MMIEHGHQRGRTKGTTMSSSTWMTRRETAVHLRVDPKTVDRYVREGKLTKYSLAGGPVVRFRRDEVEGLVSPVMQDVDTEGNPPAA